MWWEEQETKILEDQDISQGLWSQVHKGET